MMKKCLSIFCVLFLTFIFLSTAAASSESDIMFGSEQEGESSVFEEDREVVSDFIEDNISDSNNLEKENDLNDESVLETNVYEPEENEIDELEKNTEIITQDESSSNPDSKEIVEQHYIKYPTDKEYGEIWINYSDGSSEFVLIPPK